MKNKIMLPIFSLFGALLAIILVLAGIWFYIRAGEDKKAASIELTLPISDTNGR
jgi:hypothetical protein